MTNLNRMKAKITSLINCLRGLPEREILNAVNTFVNKHIEWVSDPLLYKVIDYWASPRETMKHMAGDCEDIAILKYWILMRLGLSPVFYYCHIRLTGQAHIVCVCNGLVLDTRDINAMVIQKSWRTDLTFGYAFDNKQLWAKGRAFAIADISMSKFKSMLRRMA